MNVPAMGKGINPVLDAKQHVCTRRDKSNLESRFINVVKGHGVFTTMWIEEGSFIVEYRGVLRGAGECNPDAYSYYFIYNNTRYCIDASVDDGSLGRLVNDDNNPNARVKVISISHLPHLCLFALRDIQPGEEITFDYGGYDLPWRRGTWLCMGNPSQLSTNEEQMEQSSESDTTGQKECEEEVQMQADKATQTTEEKECEEDVPAQADKATQTSEEISSEEKKRIQGDPVTSGQHGSDVEPTPDNTEASKSQLTNQQNLKPQQTSMEAELFVEEQSCPMSAAQHMSELTSNNTEASESQITNQMTEEVGKMECNKEAEQQILEQQQNSMEDEASMEEQPCPVSDAENICEEQQPTCQDEPCQDKMQLEQSPKADQDSYLDDSNDEAVSSDEEFLPDSDTESEEDSEIERPRKKAKTSVALKKIEKQATPSIQQVTQATKLNFCFVCGKACTKIARHLKLHRKDSIEIATAFKLRKNSKQRLHILEVLRNRGNYKHNNLVLNNGSGLIKVKRMPKDGIDTQKFEYCMYCKALYMRKELWRHVRRCTSNPERDTQKTSRSILGLAALSQCPHLNHISEDVKKMLCDMHQDEVAQAVRNDEFILKLAQDFFDKKGNSKERHAFIRQTIRCIGKFLILLRNNFGIRNLAEAIKPSSFSMVNEAVKEIAEFNEEKRCFTIPSLARRIGLALRKYSILSALKAYEVRDKILIQATSTFINLLNNAQSQFALGEQKRIGFQSTYFLVPFVNDVRIFHCYMEKAAQCAMKELRETPSAQSYADLCKVTLAQILMFNRRHGEVSQMTMKSFQERDQVQTPEISETLTELEKVFCGEYCKILVRQKVGALVPIILTPDIINALMLLTEKRDKCSVFKGNIYVFGQPKSNRCYRGENALQICANECGAINPDHLTSTKFSRHVSTLSQVLTLKNHELKQLAKFIGHDISLRKEYYRQTEATPRLAKICKLILAIEKGSADKMLGQSIDDIVLPNAISESDSEDDYFKEDNDFLKDRKRRVELAINLLSKKKEAQAETSNSNVPAVTPSREEKGSTSKEQDGSTSREPEAEGPAQEQVKQQFQKKPLKWSREEKIAVMKHFKKHIYYGRLATVKESRLCQMLEQPMLNGRSIQKIRDFVRNAGISLKKKKAAVKGLKKNVALPPQPANPNSTAVQSSQSTNTSASGEPSSQNANSTSTSVKPSPPTDLIMPNIIFSQTANATTATTLSSQATISTIPNVVHSQPTKFMYVKVPDCHSANQTTANLSFPSQAVKPSRIPATVVLPQTANQSMFSVNKLTLPQVTHLTSSNILIPQVPNRPGSSVLPPQAAPLICLGVLVPQAANPTTYNVLAPPAAKPTSSTLLFPQITVLKSANVPSSLGVDPSKSTGPAQVTKLSNSSTLSSQATSLPYQPKEHS